MSFLGEIKRRKVFQVAAVYAVVAWLLIQIVDVVGGPLNLPEWIDAVVIVLLAVGFPIAVILAWAFDLTPEGIKVDSEIQDRDVHAQIGGQQLNYVLQALVLFAVGFLVVDQYVREPGTSDRGASTAVDTTNAVRRFSINLAMTEGSLQSTADTGHIALSPSGSRLVYTARMDGTTRLYLRSLDKVEDRLMPGTDGAQRPFFSPDGEWVGFYTDSTNAELMKISVLGGPAQGLTNAVFSGGGSWVADDTIIYGSGDAASGRRLYSISANGGAPTVLIEPDAETGHARPVVLPGANAVLFIIRPGTGGGAPARDGRIAVASLETGEVRDLIHGGYAPSYSPSGHIVFARAGALWAVPFDLSRLEPTGPQVPVVDGVLQHSVQGAANYAFSDDGLLIYAPGGDMATLGEDERSLVWVDRSGREELLIAERRPYANPSLSPDDKRLAVTISDGTVNDIWIHDLERGSLTPLTTDADTGNNGVVWTPDSQRVIFFNRDQGGLFWTQADGVGQPERLTTSRTGHTPTSISPDSGQLLFTQFGQPIELYMLSMQNDSEPQALFASSWATISPNGRWLAYQSSEAGRLEVYVRPFPETEGAVYPVSLNGGREPHWGPEGDELFFRNGDEMMVVTVTTDPNFSATIPSTLFVGDFSESGDRSFSVSRDGQRFLMIKDTVVIEQGASGATQFNVVENWFEELERLAPPSE